MRLYGHCTKDNPSHVTLFGQNMGPQPVNFLFGNKYSSNLSDIHIQQYQLTAKNGNLLSKRVCLNGQEIEDPSPELPGLLPKTVGGFHMEPFSFSFWTVSVPKGSVC